MSEAVALASSCPLPHAVAASHDMHLSSSTDNGMRNKMLKHDNSHVQVAPYQALPVAGPIITHHRASGLKILEPSQDIPEEVSRMFD